MIEPICIESRRAADDPVNLITLCEQEFGQIRAVLPGDTGNERFWRSFAGFGGQKNRSDIRVFVLSSRCEKLSER